MDHPALSQLSKDDLIALLLAQGERIAELERRLGLNSGNSGDVPRDVETFLAALPPLSR